MFFHNAQISRRTALLFYFYAQLFNSRFLCVFLYIYTFSVSFVDFMSVPSFSAQHTTALLSHFIMIARFSCMKNKSSVLLYESGPRGYETNADDLAKYLTEMVAFSLA